MARPKKTATAKETNTEERVLSRDENVVKSRTSRRERIRIQGSLKLDFSQFTSDKSFFYYAPTDQPGNLEKFQRGGFEFVLDSQGNKVTASGGQGLTHYLMKLPMEYYKEDQDMYEDELNRRMDGLTKVNSGFNEYAPDGEVLRERKMR